MPTTRPTPPTDRVRPDRIDRRGGLRRLAGLASLGMLGMAGLDAPAALAAASKMSPTGLEDYPISLAQWSLHRAIRGGTLDPLDFPKVTRETYGLAGCEYVNSFYKAKLHDGAYFKELAKRASDVGVESLLIMIDGEGALGAPDAVERQMTVARHMLWAIRAKALGCHSIRVNAQSSGPRDEQARLAADGLRTLAERCSPLGLNVIVENHGGYSSDGDWLAGVIASVDLPNCGTLPDFGNFRLQGDEWFDRYRGVELLMPFAKAVSAKSHAFDAAGDETGTDYGRMMKIVRASGYRGWVGIEYEGGGLSENEGILATRRLLERNGCRAAAPIPGA
ncbi:MAG: sugar phosphate isomerase/epimerase family protein [Phycisphaerales bacterium]